MRRIFELCLAVAMTWAVGGLDARAADPDEPTGWSSKTVQPAQPTSSRRQWTTPFDLLNGPRSRPVTLMQPYAGRAGYNCEEDSLTAPARLPVPPPDILPISATETIGETGDVMQLAANEPARVILEIRDRVGTNLFAGTIFQDTGDEPNTSKQFAQPAKSETADHLLVRCIRELEQRREQQSAASTTCTGDDCDDDQCACCNGRSSMNSSPEAVQALRLASRQLQEVAELLEEQNLYGRADQLREMADALRQEARSATQALSESQAD